MNILNTLKSLTSINGLIVKYDTATEEIVIIQPDRKLLTTKTGNCTVVKLISKPSGVLVQGFRAKLMANNYLIIEMIHKSKHKDTLTIHDVKKEIRTVLLKGANVSARLLENQTELSCKVWDIIRPMISTVNVRYEVTIKGKGYERNVHIEEINRLEKSKYKILKFKKQEHGVEII